MKNVEKVDLLQAPVKLSMRLVVLVFASLFAATLASAQTPPAPAKTAEAQKPADAGKKNPPAAAKAEPAKAASLPKDIKKLIIEDTIVGHGKVAAKGKMIKVNYSGWLYDPSQPMGRGKQFDTSIGGEPFTFKLGEGIVIKGWDEGFETMKVGGKRKLIIPAELGYGARGAGKEIPPNAPLMFEVELLDVM